MPQFRVKPAWTFTLLALPLLAQYRGEPPGAVGGVLWPDSVPVRSDPASVREKPGGSISAELLRYPLPGKARHMMQKAVQLSGAGDHAAAIDQLKKTLTKFPGTGAYVYSLIGVEYLKTHQFGEAVDALVQATELLPHDASNHANLGLAFVANGQGDRAEPELRRALELDPHYSLARKLLDVLAVTRSVPK